MYKNKNHEKKNGTKCEALEVKENKQPKKNLAFTIPKKLMEQ